MKEGTKELLRYGATFLVLLAFFYGGTFVLKYTLGTENPMMVVISQSMIPTLGVGDFIFIEAIDDFDAVVAGPPPEGDILVFVRPGFEDEFIVHRAIDKWKNNGGWVFRTKGDNNSFPDGVPITDRHVLGRVINRMPIVGYFSLFIKTMRGFGLVALLMIVSFFYDGFLPRVKHGEPMGKTAWLSLLPFSVALITIALIYTYTGDNLTLEYLTLASWYIGSMVLPLSVTDDDMGLMIWLYHLVLLMIPITCDIVWWTMHITPSMWWNFQGSIVPVTWLLIEESGVFNRAFNVIFVHLLPGILVFLGLIYAKRSGVEPFRSISLRLQGRKNSSSLEEEKIMDNGT